MNLKKTTSAMGRKCLVPLVALLICQWGFSQQTSFTGVGNVETTVVEQVLSVEAVQNLSFASIFPISTPETITLNLQSNNPNQPPTVTVSNANLLIIDTPLAGIWDILGVPNALVTVNIPEDGTVTIEDTSGNSMAVDNFNIRSVAGAAQNITLNSSGNARFAVAATLSVGANQTPGAYTGTYAITVNYQ